MQVPDLVRDPQWFAYRYDETHDAFQFRRLARAAQRAATFLTDEYLGAGTLIPVHRAEAVAAAPPPAPLHFIFHSAFCCSTLLARALDVDGLALSLREPLILNDLVGLQQRGATAREIAAVLDDVLLMLACAARPGEAVVVKPSNVVNGMAPAILAMRHSSCALLLHAPLPVFVGSVARKGLAGRLWVRDLLVKQLREGLHPFGFTADEYLGQTDLQVAAAGWLAQQALFARIAGAFPGRVATLDSETLLAQPEAALVAIARLFKIPFNTAAIAAGPILRQHAKTGAAFDSSAREAGRAAEAPHAEEIAQVVEWAGAVAAAAGVPMDLAARLLPC